ncbi:MAG: alpha/beta hydrolase [Chloroflexi bacterium]|nr:alpha/beta hydrolase [Chloroflexota bacterium]
MPLHPQARAVLDQLNAQNAQVEGPVTLEMRRKMIDNAPRRSGPEVGRIEDRVIPGPETDLPIRVYTPEGTPPFGALVWFHGGGWVIGSIESHDAACRSLCVSAGCVVVSVDYRLAPETKFPGPAEDCYVATRWVQANAARIGVDGNKVAVGGDSSGGNLAAAVALMARDRGEPRLAFQLLVYPVIDRDFTTESYQANAKGYLLTRAGMIENWRLYLRDDADAANPYAAPLQASDLTRLPPTLVITAEFDPLRDEGEAYGRRLAEAGVAATCSRYDGMIHGFFSFLDAIDMANDAVAEAAEALKTAFEKSKG